MSPDLSAFLAAPALSHALQAVFASSLLILLVLAIRKPVARHFGAGTAYALWLLPLVRLVLPPLPQGASLMGMFRSPATDAIISQPSAAAPPPSIPEAPATGLTNLLAEIPAAPAPPVAPEAPQSLTTSLAAALPDYLALLGVALLLVWAVGALFCIARSLQRHYGFMAVLDRESHPLSDELQALSVEVAREAGLKRMPQIVTSLISSGPFVTGLLRPTVVLPAWFEEDYTRSEARAAIAHEMTHVKRGDLWALQASELFVAIMWFNPLAYVARRAFRTDQEAACDADVLRRGHASPHAYGATLVKAVRMQMPARLALTTSLPLTHALKERLKLMSYPAPDTRRRWIGLSAAALLGTAALAGTASVATAGETEKRDLHIENGTFWMDGKKVENRQIVLLSDPVADLLPGKEWSQEIATLTENLSREAVALAQPAVTAALADVSQGGAIEEITRLSLELASMATQDALHGVNMAFSGRSDEEIEAWATALEARSEAMAARIEARAEEFAARAERADTAAIERNIEARAADIEAAVARHYGDDFKAMIAARSNVIPDMAAQCASAELGDHETRILEHVTETGTRLKLACVSGGPGAAQSEMAAAYINSHPGLTEAERKAFEAHRRDGKHVFTYSRRSDTQD